MKILAKFFQSSVFVFLPAVVCAQGPCGFSPLMESALANEITDMGRGGRADIFEYLDVFGHLEDGQNCLNDKLEKLKESVEFEKRWNTNAIDIRGNADDIKDLRDKLKQAELDLYTAETRIETLENNLATAEDEIQELKFGSRIPPRPASRKPATSKSSRFIPVTPSPTPHPTSKKPDATKPMPSVGKPTSGFVPDFPPMSPASKPKAPDSKPTPAVKDGTN